MGHRASDRRDFDAFDDHQGRSLPRLKVVKLLVTNQQNRLGLIDR